jgi:hypothetical protein
VEHQDAFETPVLDTFCNVAALHDVVAVPIDDLPGVTHEVVVASTPLAVTTSVSGAAD